MAGWLLEGPKSELSVFKCAVLSVKKETNEERSGS